MARNLLLTRDLKQFKLYCKSLGFKELAPTNCYEALRMKCKGAKGVLIVYERQHEYHWLTVQGLAEEVARKFYAQVEVKD